ncbi:hypothetical protein [Sulfobacillus sp. hq2]|uniref:hypothetical protein n=1 Tax=Sulfobacillus TaxID=28033 RepID=UPI000CD2E930|nr:hypothetical protein [Sulfobacillus sp. hq2]POB11790.1 hypothetical protein CO251_03020 [Sulfobacillus sp. hq2]
MLVVNYYQTLIDVALFLFFVIGAKVIALFTIRVKKPAVPYVRHLLWQGYAVWWLVSGIVQIPPWVVTHSPAHLGQVLYRHDPPRVVAFYHFFLAWWTAKPITWNILVILVQILVGLMLITEEEDLAGRITLVVAGIWSFLVWLIPEALGHLLGVPFSAVPGAPGAGLIAAGIAAILLVPPRHWHVEKTPRGIRQIIAVYCALAALVQMNPWSGLWGPDIRKIFAYSPVSGVQKVIGMAAQIAHNSPEVYNLGLSIYFLILAVALWRNGNRWLFIGLASVLWLWIWLTGQGLGLVPEIGDNLNTAPLVLWLIAITVGRPMGMTKNRGRLG